MRENQEGKYIPVTRTFRRIHEVWSGAIISAHEFLSALCTVILLTVEVGRTRNMGARESRPKQKLTMRKEVEPTGNADEPRVSLTQRTTFVLVAQEISSVFTWVVPLLSWSTTFPPQKPTTETSRRTSLPARMQMLEPLWLEKARCKQPASPPEQRLSSHISLRVSFDRADPLGTLMCRLLTSVIDP
jgi:hypothetical protein